MTTTTGLSDLEDMAIETSWMSRGVCSQTDPEVFFAPPDGNVCWWDTAVAVCLGCPVRDQCLAYAIEHGIAYGVWGGSTEADRRPLLDEAA